MLKRLPIIFSLLVFLFVFFHGVSVAATGITVISVAPESLTPTPFFLKVSDSSAPVQVGSADAPQEGDWVPDANVTFVGKAANRAGDFLDWTLRNYDWACVTKNANGTCSNNGNPLNGYWFTVWVIVNSMLIGVVLIAAFVMIITRGRSLTITRFIPRFIFIVVLIALSYSIVQFLYQITDIVQGFFLQQTISFVSRGRSALISTNDLIFIGFPYKTFEGLKRFGPQYDESAFVTLLLVRLTAITYYVMTGILIIRKIILWFFIILSPVFPLLLFFRPIRNTGKIWIGEFFRWLLYAPLFAILLHGLVVLWKSGTPDKAGIPLAFDFVSVGHIPGVEADIIYPTAVNILIGGPGQTIGPLNSVNLQDTFALYVVSLLMLWVVIILPFILLKIFLDAMGNLSLQDNPSFKRLLDRGSAFVPGRTPPAPTPPAPLQPQGAGRAMQIPFGASRSMSNAQNASRFNQQSVQSITSIPVNAQILQLANLSVPKMRDIAKFETSMVTKNQTKMQDVSRLKTSLSRISNPTTVSSPAERERYTQVKQELVAEKQKGNELATNILNAANVSSTQVSSQNTQSFAQNTANIAGRKAPSSLAPSTVHLPAVNKVQQVSIEDYEEVRKMWEDTYQNAAPPGDLSGKKETREEWVKADIDKINQAITLLNSVDPVRNKEGMDMVSNILPFLMIGGFSKTEVVAYLKAKLEAAKTVLSGANKKDDEEDTMLENKKQAAEAEKHLSTEAQAELPTEDAGNAKIEDMRRHGGV